MTDRPTTDGSRPDLAAAVSALCDGQRVQVERDPVAVKAAHAEAVSLAKRSGSTSREIDAVMAAYRTLKAASARWADRPSLLSQLRQAVGHGSETGQERAGGAVRIPVRPDALDQLTVIREGTRDALDLCKLDPRVAGEPLAGDLRRLAVAAWPASAAGESAARDLFAARVDRWVGQVRNLLDPDPAAAERSARDTPCMSCSALYLPVRRDGDVERVPALQVDRVDGLVRGIACRVCGAYVWREVDADGEPAGSFAELRDYAQTHHAAMDAWAAGLRDVERQAREAREFGARHGAPHLDMLASYDTWTAVETLCTGPGEVVDEWEATYAQFVYTDGSHWQAMVSRRQIKRESRYPQPRRSA